MPLGIYQFVVPSPVSKINIRTTLQVRAPKTPAKPKT